MSYQQGYGQPQGGYGGWQQGHGQQKQQQHQQQQQSGYCGNVTTPVGPPRQRGNYPPVQPDYSQAMQAGGGHDAPLQPQGDNYAYGVRQPPAHQGQGGYAVAEGDHDASPVTPAQDAARTAQQNGWGQPLSPIPAQSAPTQQGHTPRTPVQQAGGWSEQRQPPAPDSAPPSSQHHLRRGYEDHVPFQQNQGRYSAQQTPNAQQAVQHSDSWVHVPASVTAPTTAQQNGGYAAQAQPGPFQAGGYHAQPQPYSTQPPAHNAQPQPGQARYQQGAYQAAAQQAPAQQSNLSVVSPPPQQPTGVYGGVSQQSPSLQQSTHGPQPRQLPPVPLDVHQAPPQQGGYAPRAQQQGYSLPAQQQGYPSPAQQQGYAPPTQQHGYTATARQQGYAAPAQHQGYAPPAQATPVHFQQQQGYAPTQKPQQPKEGPSQPDDYSFSQQAGHNASAPGFATVPPPPTGYTPSTCADFSVPATPIPPLQGGYIPSTVAPTPVSSHAQADQLLRGPVRHGMMPQQQPIPPEMQGRQEQVRESDFVNPSNDIERRLNELSLKSLNLTSYVARPGFGQQGKPISVLANIFAAKFKDGKGKTIHHYDIDIDPVVKVSSQKKPVTLLRAVWEQLAFVAQGPWAAPFQAAAFDGRKNAFTPVKFPIEGHSGTRHQIIIALPEQGSTDADEARRFKVVIKHVADVDLESLADFCRSNSQSQHAEEMMLTAVMSVNVLLRDTPTKKYCSVGASGNRFFSLQGAVDLPGGAIVCRGFMQSFRYTNSGGPGVQIDTAYSAFSSSGGLLDVAAKILGIGGGFGGGFGGGCGGPGGPGGGFGGRGGLASGPRPGGQLHTLQPGDISMLKSKLKLAKFKVTHRPSSRVFTIMSITQQAAEDISFILEGKDGQPDRKVNICTYFKEMYGVTVTKPRLPCVAFGKKGYIPMEFVDIEPFHSLPPMRLSSDQTAEMIKVSARPPRERADHIMNWRRELAYEKQVKLAAWGIEISPNMMDVQARVLAPPTIKYANGDARANNGSWSLLDKKFIRDCTPLKAWSVVSFDRYCDAPKMGAFIGKLVRCLASHGIKVETTQPPLLGPFNPNQDGSIKQGLGDAAGAAYKAGGRAPQLVIVLLPGRDQWIYESIKRTAFCDLKAPIPTQCLQTMKLKNERGLDQYCDNVSMKIHVKLGGLTHQVPLTNLPHCDRTTMLVGVDVTHAPPKPGSDTIAPSIAVSVATHNETCDAYTCQIRLQEGREETCQDLAGMMEAHVRLFEQKNRVKPCKLIIFRDGVSEGQYAAVVQNEFDAVLRGCRAVHHDYRPKVSFIIAAKRHNMRFFASNPKDVDRSGNLPPGLVVDNGVVHPFAFDFYLQAHAGLVGTSRPTHYLALIDEIKFSPDELHRLVNSLCYSFVRATRSVSLIPVAYTADIICSQVRTMVHDDTPSETTDSEYSGGHGGFKPRKTRDFDPLRLQNRLNTNPEMADVQWYM